MSLDDEIFWFSDFLIFWFFDHKSQHPKKILSLVIWFGFGSSKVFTFCLSVGTVLTRFEDKHRPIKKCGGQEIDMESVCFWILKKKQNRKMVDYRYGQNSRWRPSWILGVQFHFFLRDLYIAYAFIYRSRNGKIYCFGFTISNYISSYHCALTTFAFLSFSFHLQMALHAIDFIVPLVQ